MKKSLRDIMVAAAGLILLLLLSVSCSLVFEDPDVKAVEQEGITMVTFEMDLPLLPSATRTPAGDYDSGNAAFENYIDYWNDLRFYIFDSSNSAKFLGCISPDSTYVEGLQITGSDYKRYTLRALLAKSVTDKIQAQTDSKFRLVAMANCGTYPEIEDRRLKYKGTEITTLSQMADSMTFSIGENFPLTQLDRNNLIPMFGVKECGGVDFVAGGINDIGEIHMLRALAKVEVCVSEKEYKDLKSVVLNGYNLGGLCAPKNVTKQSDYVHNDYTLDYVDKISLVNGIPNETNAELRQYDIHSNSVVNYDGGIKRKVFTVYVPEYRNLAPISEDETSPADYMSKMKLEFDDVEDTREYTLEFKYYDRESATAAGATLGSYFNIRRNNYYKFKVLRTYELDVKVEVVPYIGVTLEPNFGFDDFLPSIN